MVSVLGLALMGGPLVARDRQATDPFRIPAATAISASLSSASAPIAEVAPATPASALPAPASTDPLAWFVPGGQNQGTQDLALTLANIALEGNEPLYLSGTWGRQWGSARSDHHEGNTDAWAVDLAVLGIQQPTPQTEEAARRVATALGRPDWTGGDLQVTIQGYRFQVLWKVSGHFNHVHVGVKKV